MRVAMTEPLFTASRGFALLDTTPEHVDAEVSGAAPDEPTDQMDMGKIRHGVLLVGDGNVELIDAPDWRTKAAKEARDAARAAGRTPLLKHRWPEVQAMVTVARRRLEAHEPPTPFVGGDAEKSLFFELDGVACRSTPDWVHHGHRHICEYKSTDASAHPGAFSKTVWGNGYAFQAMLERLAVSTVYGIPLDAVDFRWIVQETYLPYALSAVSLAPEAWDFARQQVREALRLWKQCRERNEWPGYPARTAYAELPGWMQTQWAERAYYQEASR